MKNTCAKSVCGSRSRRERKVSNFARWGQRDKPAPIHPAFCSHRLRGLQRAAFPLSSCNWLNTALGHTVSRNMAGPLSSGRCKTELAQAQRDAAESPVRWKENEQPDRLTMSSAGCGFLFSFLVFDRRQQAHRPLPQGGWGFLFCSWFSFTALFRRKHLLSAWQNNCRPFPSGDRVMQHREGSPPRLQNGGAGENPAALNFFMDSSTNWQVSVGPKMLVRVQQCPL